VTVDLAEIPFAVAVTVVVPTLFDDVNTTDEPPVAERWPNAEVESVQAGAAATGLP
jgi:hypothetical protein